jgi:general secretion pathway protein F
MGAFDYKAVDPSGKEIKGVLEGETARQVRQLLRDQQLLPIAVTEVAEKETARQFNISFRRGLSPGDLALITRQIATLVQSSMPLEQALLAVGEQNEIPRVKSIVLGVRARVMEGYTFADGLASFPKAFPELYRATVAAGEQSGHLDAVLERLADYTESRQELRQKILNAMIYPIVLTVLAIAIVSGMLVYVVPKVIGVFANTDRELPMLTSFLIRLSEFLQSFGILVLAVLIAVAIGTWILLQQQGPREQFDRFLLRMPLFGRLVRGFNTARFTRTFSILMGSGVPIIESLHISAQVVTNMCMKSAVDDAALRIREGESIGTSLGDSGHFPPLCIHLISSGEASGQLETMLSRAASNQEREMDGLIGTLLNILEPALIIGMGAMVLLIVLAILLPIFQLNELVG